MKCLAFLLALLAPSAHSVEWELGLGQSYATAQRDGEWYQKAFPHSLKLKSTAVKIGLTDAVTKNLRWHLDAVHLGRYDSDSLATPHDGNYDAGSPSGCNGACLPLVRYTGSGTVGGIAATLEAHTRGPWKLGVEGGPFLYRASWHMRVPQWYASEQKGGEFKATSSPRNLDFRATEWKVGGVLGLTAGKGPWTLSLRHYMSGAAMEQMDGNEWPAIWRSHTVLMLNHRY